VTSCDYRKVSVGDGGTAAPFHDWQHRRFGMLAATGPARIDYTSKIDARWVRRS
jgi:hypothetical protein